MAHFFKEIMYPAKKNHVKLNFIFPLFVIYFSNQTSEIFSGAENGIDFGEIRYVVSKINHWTFINWRQPNRAIEVCQMR